MTGSPVWEYGSKTQRKVPAGSCKPPDLGTVRYRDRQFAKQPVTGITWFQARDYAAWVGGRLPTEAEVSAWFANGPDAVCILCGGVSGHAEMIDFDAGGELFHAWTERIPQDLLARLTVETTQRGGRHVFYRCEAPVCGNMKLAQRLGPDGKVVTLIETRGEGGLFLCAPTAGYEAIQGDLRAPPVLTEADRDALLAAAWELNEYLPPPVGETRPCGQRDAKESPVAASGDQNSDTGVSSADSSDNRHSRPHNSENGPISASSVSQGASPADNSHRPGDDFNDRGDVRDVLAQHGWALVRSGTNEYWRRPGKTSGWSASLKSRVFYVFSANAAPFEPNRAYSPFSVYTLLNHGGDYETAARSLRMSGYGGDGPSDIRTGVDLSGILGQTGACGADDSHNAARAPEIPDPGPMPDHLLRIPGFVGEVMDYCLATAPYPNPVMAFAGIAHLAPGQEGQRAILGRVSARLRRRAPDHGAASGTSMPSRYSASTPSRSTTPPPPADQRSRPVTPSRSMRASRSSHCSASRNASMPSAYNRCNSMCISGLG